MTPKIKNDRAREPINVVPRISSTALIVIVDVDVVLFIDDLIRFLERSTEPACQPIDVSWRIQVNGERAVMS